MNFLKERNTVVRKKAELSCPQIKCLLDERMKTKIFFFSSNSFDVLHWCLCGVSQIWAVSADK